MQKSMDEGMFAGLIPEEYQHSLTRDKLLTESSIPCVACGEVLENSKSKRKPRTVTWRSSDPDHSEVRDSLIHQACVGIIETDIAEAQRTRDSRAAGESNPLG